MNERVKSVAILLVGCAVMLGALVYIFSRRPLLRGFSDTDRIILYPALVFGWLVLRFVRPTT